MQSWAKIVPIGEIKDGQHYFVGKVFGGGVYAGLEFHVRGLNKKLMWGGKPGIAVRYEGSANFREYMAKSTDCVAVEVPTDADTRWKARKRRF